MEDFDYSVTLAKLNNDKEATILKLKAIEMAIEAITQLNSSSFVFKDNGVFTLKTFHNDTKPEKKSPYEDYIIEVPIEYDNEMPVIEKLIYALSIKKGAFAHDAAEYIYSIDQTEKLEYLKTRFTDIASGLGRAQKLNIKKIGKKYKYMIKEEDKIDYLL